MVCSSCGTENRPGRKFCSECAAPLAVACPACGAANQPGEKFCGECGSNLAATPAPSSGVTGGAGTATTAPGASPSTSGAVAERRLVSILFTDLVGFTTLTEGRDPEETRELLSRYFEVARDVVSRYGGSVEKFIGDAVMAVWGAPTAHEDDAERAVRSALEMVDAVRQLVPGLQARAAVLTGEAAVTLGASGQGMVAGDLVNTASRLQSVAAPGTVLVDEATRRAASQAIAFEPAGEQTLKGKEAPIAAARALRIVAERGGRGRSDRLEAPFVGRDIELRLLKDFFHATGRERRPRLVSITGPAGIGKSRLAWELSKYLDGVVEQVYWHAGRSPSYGEGVTFWALGEMVRGRAGLLEIDDESTTRAKVTAVLERWIPDATERNKIEPALLALLGLEPAPAGGREELFALWRTFFERIAAQGTTVLAFEDLQWADTGLLDFIDHLLEWSRSVPIFVITLARPELLERRPGWGAGRRNFVALTLEPLPEPAMRELLEGLVPGLPEAAIRRIVERADGIPLYAVETVRMLVGEARLVERDGVYRPSGDLSDLAVPETLQALIAARLDSLDPQDRALLQDAAVLGDSFSRAALAGVTGVSEEELEVRLRDLVRRELLTVDGDPRSPERGQYAFIQALIREVAYGTLARRERRAKHLAAARYFESLGDDELAGALAAHYLAAHRESPPGPEAEALAVQARLALRGAADRAAALGSHEQAMAFLEQALAVTSDPTEVGELLEQAGEAAAAAARNEHAERLLKRAVAAWQALGDGEASARASARLARLYSSTSRPDQAVALLEPLAVDGMRTDSPSDLLVRSQLARAYFFAGDAARAAATADQVLAAAEHVGDVPIVADTLVTKGTALGMLGRIQEGRALVAGGRTLAEQRGLSATAIRAYVNESAIVTGMDPRQAFELARRGLEEARRLGQRHMGLALFLNSTQAAERTGAWAWAVEAAAIESPDLEGGERSNVLLEVVRLMALRGEPTDDAAAEVERLLAGYADIQSTAELESMRALRAFAQGQLAIACDAWLRAGELGAGASEPTHFLNAARAALWAHDATRARAALERFDRAGVHGAAYETFRQVIVAGLACLEGRPELALPAYREALRSWRDLGLAFDQSLTAIDMAELLPLDAAELASITAAARDILVQLEARPFVERLDAALVRRALAAPESGAQAQPEGGSRFDSSASTASV